MKIDHLYCKDFLGTVLIDVPTPAPVQIFTGQNGAGKSSLRDGVALALTADLGRVNMKKDVPQLIREGQGSAVCEVRAADGTTYGVTITASGKMASTFKGEVNPAMAYVLDSQRFAKLDDKARRAFLFGLLGVKLDAKSIAARLVAMGCDAALVERVAPLLRSGFGAAADDAREKATQAKGAWRGLTGETYGAVKALTWQAPAVAFSQQNLDAALQQLAALDTSIATAQQNLGGMEAAVNTVAAARAKVSGLKETEALLVRRKVKLATDETALAEAQTALDNATAKAGTAPRVGLVHDLARSVNALLRLGNVPRDSVVGMDAVQALDAYEVQHGSLNAAVGDSESQARLPALTQARDLMASAVRNSMRDVKASEDAATEIKLLEEQIAAVKDASPGALDVARQQLATAQAERKTAQAAVETLRAAKAAAEGARRVSASSSARSGSVARISRSAFLASSVIAFSCLALSA